VGTARGRDGSKGSEETPKPSVAGTAADTAVVPWQPARAWIEGADAVRDIDVRDALDARSRGGADAPRDTRSGRHRRPMPPGPRFLTLPSSLVGARLGGSRGAIVGLVVVVVVAAAGFGVRVAWARAASAPQVVAPAQPGSALVSHSAGGTTFASSSTASGGGGPPTGSPGATAGGVTVHVVGQVKAPGVFQLPAGARVADAVAKAGGALKGADLASVNLARVLIDGEQVRVPKPGEVVVPPGSGTGGAAAGAGPPGGPGSGAAGASGAGGGVGGKLDLNTATAAQLEELPGVGPVLAQRIVDWRTEHGRFASVDELGEVSGIGEKIFAELQPKVMV